MITDEIAPLDAEFLSEVSIGDRWTFTPRQTEILEGLKTKAKERGLWNFWDTFRDGPQLSTVEYAYLAEEMGKSHLAAEVFNCNAPDTGNMEVFARYGTDAMKDRWLKPLMAGTIRSAYLMTEPDIASSDATNIAMRGLAGIDRAAYGLPDEAEYVAAYAARRGLGQIDNWPFYLVFAFFRLAAILAGVAARAAAGNASNPAMARKYGAAVPALAAMATIVMHEGADL